MPDAPEDTWRTLLDKKRRDLGISEADTRIPDETQFRSAAEALCEKHHEQRIPARLNNIERLFKCIKAFAKSIDTANNHTEVPGTLVALFRTAAFKAIKTALEHKIPLQELINETKALEKVIPVFGTDLERFSTDPDVQRHLRTIFSAYIDCYKDMITHFATACPPLSYEPIHSSFDTATTTILAAKEQWDQAFESASREEKKRPLTSSTSSSINGLEGGGKPSTTLRYDVLDTLGKGSYGTVQRVREQSTQAIYARKSIDVSLNPRHRNETLSEIEEEVKIMQKLRHHHIAQCLVYVTDGDYFDIFMLPVADYDLGKFLDEECTQHNFEQSQIMKLDNWFGCLVSALTYAHQQDVRHNDIKPRNILIKDDQPYLSDFGSAIDVKGRETSMTPDDRVLGTPVYNPPEKKRGRKADVFQLGCVFTEMLTVRCRKSLVEYAEFRQQGDEYESYAYRAVLPRVQQWLTLLEDSVARHEHLTHVLAQTRKMLEPDPDRRVDAKAVRRQFRILCEDSEYLFCPTC